MFCCRTKKVRSGQGANSACERTHNNRNRSENGFKITKSVQNMHKSFRKNTTKQRKMLPAPRRCLAKTLNSSPGGLQTGFRWPPYVLLGRRKRLPRAASEPQTLPRQADKSSARRFASQQLPNTICMRHRTGQQ